MVGVEENLLVEVEVRIIFRSNSRDQIRTFVHPVFDQEQGVLTKEFFVARVELIPPLVQILVYNVTIVSCKFEKRLRET